MEQNQEMKLLLKQNSKILEFCLGGILPLLLKYEYVRINRVVPPSLHVKAQL